MAISNPKIKIEGDPSNFIAAAAQSAQASLDLQRKMKEHNKAMQSSLEGVNNSLNKLGQIIGVTFTLGAIASFTKESMKLAAEAEGVRNAFMRIGDARNILEEMKKATRGVIEESDLMTFAVKAQNLGIPLSKLGTYLEFATNRAITTGKSINEMADKIIMAVGRGSKATRAFVELGLNANDVKEAFKETGSVFGLVTDALAKMGDVTDTAAVRFGRLQANVKNLKESWGEFMNNSKSVNAVVKWATDELQMFSDKNLSFWEKINGSPNEYARWKRNIEDAKKTFGFGTKLSEMTGQWVSPFAKGTSIEEITTIETLKLKVGEYDKEIESANIKDTARIKILREERQKVKDLIEEIETGIHIMSLAQMATDKKQSIFKIGTGNEFNKISTNFPNIKMPTFGEKPNIAPGLQNWDTSKMQEWIENSKKGLEAENKMTASMAMQEEVAMRLDDVFSNMFANVDKGVKGMADAFVQSIKRMAEELAAKIAVFALMNILFPGSSVVAGGLMNFIFPHHAEGTNYAPGGLSLVGERGPELVNLPRGSQVIPNNKLGQTITLNLKGKFDGKDIYFANRNYQLKLIQNT